MTVTPPAASEPFVPQDLIARKRDGCAWTDREIARWIRAASRAELAGEQLGAWLMAAYVQGLSARETAALTRAMTASGRVLRWPREALRGPVVDKHSTGGVGDLVSLVLAPMLAAAGCHVPMISGHALGPMGGTLDKLASIPGLGTELTLDALRRQVLDIGLAIVGPTAELVPADRVLYAARDLTATVTSVPLIAASILSKKLAEGLDALVLDVKYGSGAVFSGRARAEALAGTLEAVAGEAGLPTVASLGTMDQPLAPAAGDALEVELAVAYLRGEARPGRLHDRVITLARALLEQAGRAPDGAAEALEDGRAAEAFARMVAAQGGPADFLERAAHYLPRAPLRRPLTAPRAGTVEAVDAGAVGRRILLLGGGRLRAGQDIDHAVGVCGLPSLGATVAAGEPLCEVHARTDAAAEEALAALAGAIRLGPDPGTAAGAGSGTGPAR